MELESPKKSRRRKNPNNKKETIEFKYRSKFKNQSNSNIDQKYFSVEKIAFSKTNKNNPNSNIDQNNYKSGGRKKPIIIIKTNTVNLIFFI